MGAVRVGVTGVSSVSYGDPCSGSVWTEIISYGLETDHKTPPFFALPSQLQRSSGHCGGTLLQFLLHHASRMVESRLTHSFMSSVPAALAASAFAAAAFAAAAALAAGPQP